MSCDTGLETSAPGWLTRRAVASRCWILSSWSIDPCEPCPFTSTHAFTPSNENSARRSCHTSVREHASSLCKHICALNLKYVFFIHACILAPGINHIIYTWLYVCAHVKKIYVACCFVCLCVCVWTHLNRVEGGERGNKERMITRQASCSLQICRPSSILPLHSVKHIDQPLVIERGQCAKSMFHFFLSLSFSLS